MPISLRSAVAISWDPDWIAGTLAYVDIRFYLGGWMYVMIVLASEHPCPYQDRRKSICVRACNIAERVVSQLAVKHQTRQTTTLFTVLTMKVHPSFWTL